MSDVAVASAAVSAMTRQNMSLASLKQMLEGERQIADMVAEVTDSAPKLNSSGRGQLVNTFA